MDSKFSLTWVTIGLTLSLIWFGFVEGIAPDDGTDGLVMFGTATGSDVLRGRPICASATTKIAMTYKEKILLC